MAEYTDGIERINIELSLRNKLKMADELLAFFEQGTGLGKVEDDGEVPSKDMLAERVEEAKRIIAARAQWQDWYGRIDELFAHRKDHSLRASWKLQLRNPLRQLFTGGVFEPVREQLNTIHQRVLRGKVW